MIQRLTVFPRLSTLSGPKFILPFWVCLGCGLLLWGELRAMDGVAILAALTTITPLSCLIAALATWVSLRAVGEYDAIWHRILRTEVAPQQAARSGTCAIAIAQVIGFGALSAGVVRRRMLPQLTVSQVTAISAAVPLSFMGCWGIYAIFAGWWLGRDAAPPLVWILGGCICTIGGTWFLWRRRLPCMPTNSLVLGMRLLFWTGVDMFCAAAALFVLLPETATITFPFVLAVYVLALGAGLLANSPGGVGAFDVVLLGLLPGQEGTVAALIVFRLIYYGVPAVLSGWAVLSEDTQCVDRSNSPAQWQLAHQSGAIRNTGFSVDAPLFRAGIGVQSSEFSLRAFAQAARRQLRIPVLYNCSGREAVKAHRAGWHLRRTTMEAIIPTQVWSLSGSQRQSLRRKLRAATAAGIHISEMGPHDLEDLPPIARAWKIAHGGEMALTMGRFTPAYIAQQRVFLIKSAGQTQGFVSFHAGETDWHLDLIRYSKGLPDGAVHAAIVAAIHAAQRNCVGRLSLSTVPDPRYTPPIWANRRRGLAQFKRSFAPIWVPRYHAAPNRMAFLLSGCVLAIAIHRPLANLPWKLLQLIKLLPLELKFWSKRDKRRLQQN